MSRFMRQNQMNNIPENAASTKHGLLRLASFCKRYAAAIIIALVCAVGGTVFTVIGPDKLSDLTNLIRDGLIGTVDMDAILQICITLVIFYGTSALLSYIQGLIMTWVTQRASNSMRDSISIKINKLPIGYFNHISIGDILSRVTNDVDTIGETMQRSIIQLVSAIALLIGSMIMMFKTNWIMAVTAMAASLFGFLFMLIVMKRSQKYFTARQEWLGNMNGHIEETYSGHKIIKVYNAQESMSKTFNDLNRKLYESEWKSQFLSGLMMPIMNFIGNFGYVAVCVVGAALALNNVISFGVIVAFIIYVRLFTNPLSQIAQCATSLQSAAAASHRVFDFLEAEEMTDESHKTKVLENPQGKVEFDHVCFGYEPDRVIIHDFCETVNPGEKVAIVGPTGAGKTTLVNLLMRFYELNSGEIRIDGVPETELTRQNIHDLFGMVLQDTWLFEGSIRDNIVYGRENVSDEEVKRVCKAVGMHHFIKTLPEGYHTIINDKMNLSEGQKQLLTIARAMIENAPMLILDEATSSVDTRTEILIQQAMDKLTEGRTSFVIAHRLSTIKNANKILVLRDGDIVESGTHQELLAKKGFYAELYNSQFEDAS